MEKNSVDEITNAVMIHGRFQPFTLGHMQLVKKQLNYQLQERKYLLA